MFSFAKTKTATDKLKKVLSSYYAKEIEKQMDALWKSGKMTEEKNNKIAKINFIFSAQYLFFKIITIST
jgi:hypothetical protein